MRLFDADTGTGTGATGVAPDADAAAKATADAAAKTTADAASKVTADAATKAAADAAALPGAPEKYEFKAPDGAELDAELVGEFSGLAKSLKLPQDQASKVYDLGVKLAKKQNEAVNTHIEKTRTDWETASKNDKEFGGEKLKENLGVAGKAMAAFGTPELTKFLNETGVGNHPEMIRAFYRVGKAISEDKLVIGGNKPNSEAKPLQFSFPNSKHVA